MLLHNHGPAATGLISRFAPQITYRSTHAIPDRHRNHRCHPRVFIGVAELDPYPLTWPSVALLAELVKCERRIPWFRVLRGHNHVSPAMQINSEIDTLGPELLEWVRMGIW